MSFEPERLEVFSKTEDGTVVPLSVVEAGDVIGEMALIREGQRTASVRSVTKSSLYVVEPKDFFMVRTMFQTGL